MNADDVLTKFPVQVRFHDLDRSREVELWIGLEAIKLERFYKRIMNCRVNIERSRQYAKGNPYHVRIDLTVPGGELVVNHEPTLRNKAAQTGEAEIRKSLEVHNSSKDLRQAINEAFRAASRQLQDYARRQRGDTKTHEERLAAMVTQLFKDKGYGFLSTPEGREIYFHRDSVLSHGFNRLKIGTVVTFAEEQGDKGPQASSVHILPKQGVRQMTALSVA